MINDRVTLGVVAGFAGGLAKTVFDEVSLQLKVSQRSFRTTAAGVWVNTQREAENPKGQFLGQLLDTGMSMLGGIGIVGLLTFTGKDRVIVKGLISGITLGSVITAFLSVSPTNKVKPKDSASNLSYLAAHAIYGLVTTAVAAKLGADAIFPEKSPPSTSTNGTRTLTGYNQRKALKNWDETSKNQCTGLLMS